MSVERAREERAALILSLTAASKRAGISKHALRAAIRDGRLPASRRPDRRIKGGLAGAYAIDAADLAAFRLKKLRVVAPRPERVCVDCGKAFTSGRPDAKYCGDQCLQNAARRAKRLREGGRNYRRRVETATAGTPMVTSSHRSSGAHASASFEQAKTPAIEPHFLQIVAEPEQGDPREPKLTRVAFRVSRLMEFCSERELQNQTGHSVWEWPLVVAKELIDNALDACEEAEVAPEIEVIVEPDTIIVQDNAGGIDAETIELVLDYTIRVSSREAYVSPTRGAQGNALKTILAMGYVLDRRNGGDRCGRDDHRGRGVEHRIEF